MTVDTTMDVLVFKTNINQHDDVARVSSILLEEARIFKCTVDNQDIDNVLRVEAHHLSAAEVIDLVEQSGYCCEELPD